MHKHLLALLIGPALTVLGAANASAQAATLQITWTDGARPNSIGAASWNSTVAMQPLGAATQWNKQIPFPKNSGPRKIRLRIAYGDTPILLPVRLRAGETSREIELAAVRRNCTEAEGNRLSNNLSEGWADRQAVFSVALDAFRNLSSTCTGASPDHRAIFQRVLARALRQYAELDWRIEVDHLAAILPGDPDLVANIQRLSRRSLANLARREADALLAGNADYEAIREAVGEIGELYAAPEFADAFDGGFDLAYYQGQVINLQVQQLAALQAVTDFADIDAVRAYDKQLDELAEMASAAEGTDMAAAFARSNVSTAYLHELAEHADIRFAAANPGIEAAMIDYEPEESAPTDPTESYQAVPDVLAKPTNFTAEHALDMAADLEIAGGTGGE